jgi:hypothetical protein
MTRRQAGIAALAAAVLLAGCAAQSPTPAASSSASSSPSATPVQLQETGRVRPAQVFDGDCSAVLSDTSTVIPGLAPAMTLELDAPLGEILVDQVGGLRCRWSSTDSVSSLHVVVVPNAVAPGKDATQCLDSTQADIDAGSVRCEFDVIAAGLRFSGFFFAPGTIDSGIAMAATIGDHLGGNARTAPAPIVPLPADGAWSNPLDCEALDASVDLASLLGWESAVLFEGGTDVRLAPVYYDLWAPKSAGLDCTWSSPGGEYFSFAGLGGARWAESTVAARSGAVPVSIAGIDAAYQSSESYPSVTYVTLELFDGVNWARVSPQGGESFMSAAYSALPDLLAALDTLP